MKKIITRATVGLLLIVGIPLQFLIIEQIVTGEISSSINTQSIVLCLILFGLIILKKLDQKPKQSTKE